LSRTLKATAKLSTCFSHYTRSGSLSQSSLHSLTHVQRGNFQDAINANVVNNRHFPEQEMVRLFRGTCLAVRAMHEYRPTTPRSAAAAKQAASGASKPRKPAGDAEHEDDDDNDERFPQAEGDAEGGYSYDGASASRPLVTRHEVDEEGEAVFDADEEAGVPVPDGEAPEIVPYAHRDLKPG
jgi:serine/threonine kinase 16